MYGSFASEQAVENFREYITKRLNKQTAVKYTAAVKRFLVFCGEHNLHFDRLPPGILHLYSDTLLHEGLKRSTVAGAISGVSKYLDWCRVQGAALPTMAKPDLPKTPKLPPNVLTNKALMAFFALASRLHEPIRTSLILLPFCGLRSFELAKLKISDVSTIKLDAAGERPAMELIAFSVIGKRGKFKKVPLLTDGKPLLLAYLKGWRIPRIGATGREDQGYLFPTTPNNPISPRTIRLHVQQIREKIGMDKLHPHMFRATYLTTLWRHGIDIPSLTRIAGHDSVQTTINHYLSIEADDAAAAAGGVRLVAKGAHADGVHAAGRNLHKLLETTAHQRLVEPSQNGFGSDLDF